MIFASALLALAAVQPSTAPPACTPASAIRATVAEIARAPARFLGRCVTVSGPSSRSALFTGAEGTYLGQTPSVFDARVSERHRIGLHSDDTMLMAVQLTARGAPHLIVTGIVDSCERRRPRAIASSRGTRTDLIVMSGYCHWHRGPVIDIASWVHDPAIRYERAMGEAARRRVGDLVPATARTRHWAALRAFADDFVAALRRGDRDALARLHDFRADTGHPGDRRLLAYLLDERGSPFAELRRGIGAEPAIFVRRDAAAARDEGVAGILCFCRTGNCAATWPISILDAANNSDKPYACTIVEPRDWVPRRGGLRTGVDGAWLLEPRHSALRR